MTTNSSFPPTNAVSAQTFVAGQKILNRYTLERVLGQGGMGVVWLAKDEELDRKVALKFLPSLIINDRASLNDLKRETRRSLELTHPNIVRTYDFLQDTTLAGISMEYVDSDTLRNRRIDQPSGVFQTAELGDWTVQLCEALDYAHKTAGIVHRDLKPANLLVNTRNHLKVADFGISRSLVESVTQVTGGNMVSGTLVYMSPQQLEGEPAQPLDDIYAVGTTLYELCTSRPPFFSGDISRQVHAKIPPSIADRRTELGIPHGEFPQNWETTIAACLAKDPMHRPQSANEIAVRLGLRAAASIPAPATTMHEPKTNAPTATQGFSGTTVTPPPRPAAVPLGSFGRKNEPTVQTIRKNWVPLAVGAAVVVFLVMGLVWLFGSHSGKQSHEQAKGVRPGTNEKGSDTSGRNDTDEYSGQPATADGVTDGRNNIFVATEPPGARMSVDDRPAELTPGSLNGLTPGEHSLKVTLDGYDDYISQINVKENQATQVPRIKLVRSTGALSVTTNPPGAEIAVSGPDGPVTKPHAASPWNADKLPIGEYEIDITRPGWGPVTRKVSLARAQAIPIAFELAGGNVQVASDPPNATVIVDGKPVGTTPYVLQDVQPGNVQYSLASAGYLNGMVQGQVQPGQTLQLNASLTRIAGVAKVPPAPRQTRTSSHTRRSSGGGGDDDDDPHRHEDSLDKANRAADLANKLRWMGGHFPHP